MARSVVSALLLVASAAHLAEWALGGDGSAPLSFGAGFAALTLWSRRSADAPIVAGAVLGLLSAAFSAQQLGRGFDWSLVGLIGVSVLVVSLGVYGLVTGELRAAGRLMKAHEFGETEPRVARTRRAPAAQLPAETVLSYVVLVSAWALSMRWVALANEISLRDWPLLLLPGFGLAIPCAVLASAADRVRDTRSARLAILSGAGAIATVAVAVCMDREISRPRGDFGAGCLLVVIAQCVLLVPFLGIVLGLRSRDLAKLGRAEWPL